MMEILIAAFSAPLIFIAIAYLLKCRECEKLKKEIQSTNDEIIKVQNSIINMLLDDTVKNKI